MKALTRLDRVRIILRSLFIQLFLNYRTMQGSGYLYILWPWLKQSSDRAANVRASARYVNGHPVFSSFALGASLKHMLEGGAARDAEAFQQWRESLCPPMGMTGDALIWERWKPAVFALATFVVIYWQTWTSWVLAAIGALLVYNLPLFYFRAWAFQRGLELGKDVLQLSGHRNLPVLRRYLDVFAAFAAGCVLGVSFVKGATASFPMVVNFALGFIVMLLLSRMRVSVVTSVLVALLASILLQYFFFPNL